MTMIMRDLAPDLIVTGARITTMDPSIPDAEAVAIKDGVIIAVGRGADVEALAGPATRVVQGGDRRVIPGINDTHNHLQSMGKVLSEVQLYGARSIADIQDLVGERVRDSPPGAWILGRGWDESLLEDKRFPDRHDLDDVAPNNPVMLERVWNMLLANTAALHAADVGRHTPDPPADMLYAGRIERDASGDPTGIFRDRAKRRILDAVPPPSVVDREQHVRNACETYSRLGVTSVADPGLFPEQLRAYQNVRQAGDLTVRVSMCLGGWGFGAPDDELTVEERVEHLGVYTGFGDSWLRVDAVKFMPDGGVGDRTALMFDPYEGEPDNRGQFVVSERDLIRNVAWCHARGWSVDCHACGDRMIEMVARAYAAAYDGRPDASIRHRIHHAYLPTPTALDLMREHRIPALATIPFLTSLGESFVASLGQQRAERVMPLKSYLEAGVPVALGSDAPVTTFNPWVGIYSAVTRKTVYGRVLGADERISREEALRLYTSAAAWITFEDDVKGSIAPGMLADIVALDRDVLSIPEEEIKDIQPVLTIAGGRVVHDSMGAASVP
ncbi:MAG TPA: amidohydrolase [Thermomicrobiales bacterium]|nr:amidohydrolase [Thermomicrobiales bacterium]